jgi:hypothetical protein
MVVPVRLEGVMAVLLWVCCLVVMGLVLTAWSEGCSEAPDRRWSYPVQPAFADVPVEPGPLMRANSRPALQTGVAILAVALAIDVSASSLAQFAPFELDAAVSVSGAYDVTANHNAFAAYAPVNWTVSSATTDGWLV